MRSDCRGGVDLDPLLEVAAPLVDVGFELLDIGPERDHVVSLERGAHRGVHGLSRYFAAVLLGIPDVEDEQHPVIDPARHQGGPVVGFRAVEPERDLLPGL